MPWGRCSGSLLQLQQGMGLLWFLGRITRRLFQPHHGSGACAQTPALLLSGRAKWQWKVIEQLPLAEITCKVLPQTALKCQAG